MVLIEGFKWVMEIFVQIINRVGKFIKFGFKRQGMGFVKLIVNFYFMCFEY